MKAWRDGVLVAAPPDILYAADTNGDHKADVKQVLFTGMREGNQQHRANGLRWGLDHWLHMANGDSGGVVRSLKTGAEVNISGRDFRIRPDEGLIELTSGPTQFGRSRDEFGNWFGGSNSRPVWHYAMEEKYIRRNPHVSSPASRHEVAEDPGAAPVFPTSTTLERFNDFDRANRFTSACSPEVYRNNTVFVCEPVHNLVHRSSLRKDGASFISTRRDDERQFEFLTSTDNWFRPVMVRSGPDRAIWVADMYRMVIEHPEWIPMRWQNRVDHLSGYEKGRIYRIVLPENESGRAALGAHVDDWRIIRTANDEQIVEMLDTENRILRDMVQQEIVERNATSIIPNLKKLRRTATASRVAIDYLLFHFNAFDYEMLRTAEDLQSTHVLRLVEPKLAESRRLRNLLVDFSLSHIADPQVRRQAAYSLGYCEHPNTGEALGKIAASSLSHEHDRYIRAAVMSSVSASSVHGTMKEFLLAEHTIPESSRAAVNEVLDDLVRSALGFGNHQAIRDFLRVLGSREFALQRYARPTSTLLKLLKQDDRDVIAVVGKEGINTLRSLAESARVIAANGTLTASDRLNALQLFGFFHESEEAEQETLLQLLSPRQPLRLQREAIGLLSKFKGDEGIRAVFTRWDGLTPVLRDATLSAAISKPSWTSELLKNIENGSIRSVEVNLRYRRQLMQHKDESIGLRAKKVFLRVESNRESVVKRYASQVTTTPNVAEGKRVFAKHNV